MRGTTVWIWLLHSHLLQAEETGFCYGRGGKNEGRGRKEGRRGERKKVGEGGRKKERGEERRQAEDLWLTRGVCGSDSNV